MKKFYSRSIFFLIYLLTASIIAFSQNVAINKSGNAPNAAAVLDLSDATNNTMGFAMPNVTLTNISSASPITSPPTGLVVFNTSTSTSNGLFGVGFYYWSGTMWIFMVNSNTGPATGTGITNYLARWTSVTALGTGVAQDNGTGVSISSSVLTPANKLDVNGSEAVGTYAGTAGPANGLVVSGQVGVGTVVPNASAAVDIESTTKGFLPPQMTTAQMNAIVAPATGLIIYNSTTACAEIYTGGGWQEMGCPCTAPPAEPGPITGSVNPCASSIAQPYSISPVAGATLYFWNVPTGSTVLTGGGTTGITVNFGSISGSVSVYATNSCGSSPTNSVAVTLIPIPVITVQPGAPTVCTTGTASFSLTATGTGLTYQWYEFASSWVAITNSGIYSGATSNTLTITNPTATMNGYQYECIVSGTCAPPVTSTAVTMTVNSLPAITAQPSSVAACSNANAIFSVTATGSALTYQWQQNTGTWNNLTNSGVFSGTTTANLTISSPTSGMTGSTFRCIVSGACTPSVTSSVATLTVNAIPVITSQPTSPAGICNGGGVATFSIVASGTGLTYQWYEYITGWNPVSTGGVYSGGTTTTLTITNPPTTMNGHLYECIVSGAGPCSLTSSAATLTVYQGYLPVTITNSQATATSSNFQVMLTVNSSTYAAYENTGLKNVEFTTGPGGTGSVLQAWIESNASTTANNTVYWINLAGNTIAASGTLTIYMDFMTSNIMSAAGPTGEAPQLSGTYAQYDNGSLVFGMYDNFTGTTVSTAWTQVSPAGETNTQNNGITVATTTATYGGIIYAAGYSNSPVQVFDADVTALGVGGIAQGIGLQNGGIATSGSYSFTDWGSGSVASGTMQGGLTGVRNPAIVPAVGIVGGAWTTASSEIWYQNYTATAGTQAVYALPATVYPAIGMYFSSAGSSVTCQWARTHQYAPAGVMPSASLGTVVCP